MRRQSSRWIIKQSSVWLLALSVIQLGSTKIVLISALASEQQELAPSQAQRQEKSPRSKELEREDEVEAIEREIQQALQALYQAYDLAKDLPDPVVRIRSYVAIAAAIWEHDQPFARELFRTAFAETKVVPKPERKLGPQLIARAPERLRSEVLAKAAKLDPRLAIELAKSIEPESEARKEGKPEMRSMQEASLSERSEALMSLANSLFEKDIKSASEAAAAALSEGITSSLVSFIMRLGQKDRALADALFDQALRATLRNNPPLVLELVLLGSYVLPGIPLPISLSDGGESPPVNPAQAAQYLNALVEALASHIEIVFNPAIAPNIVHVDWFANAQSLYQILTTIRPYVMQFVPQRSPMVEALCGQLMLKVSQRRREEIEKMEAKKALSPEEKISDLLRQADKVKGALERDALLFQAIHQAVQADKFDTALEIIPKINDLKLRKEVSDFVHYRRVKKALEGGDVETARRSALELNHPERITLALIAIARKLSEQRENDAALALLGEAETRIKRLPSSPEKARSLLQIADALLPLDTNRSFDVLHLALRALNQSEAAIERTEGANFRFVLKGYGASWNIAEENLIPVLERVISTLEKTDSARAFSAILSFENPSLRIIAQVSYARSRLEQAREKKARLVQKKSAN